MRLNEEEFLLTIILSHHGVKGQKWGVRRYQNADGSITPAGRKRYEKNEAYRSKLASKASRKSEAYSRKAASAEENMRDLRENGVNSKAYQQWKKDEYRRREQAYEREHSYTDDKGNKYKMRYDKSFDKFGDDLFDSLGSRTTINKLIDKNSREHQYYVAAAETWLKANQNLMNMTVTEMTSRSEIRRNRWSK